MSCDFYKWLDLGNGIENEQVARVRSLGLEPTVLEVRLVMDTEIVCAERVDPTIYPRDLIRVSTPHYLSSYNASIFAESHNIGNIQIFYRGLYLILLRTLSFSSSLNKMSSIIKVMSQIFLSYLTIHQMLVTSYFIKALSHPRKPYSIRHCLHTLKTLYHLIWLTFSLLLVFISCLIKKRFPQQKEPPRS
jgi:hypothetical protein